MASFTRTVDLDLAQGIPTAGLHRAKCVEADIVPIKSGANKGGENLYLVFAVQTPSQVGRRVRSWTPILPQTMWKYTRVLQAFGVKGKSESDPTAKISEKTFLGKFVRIQTSLTDVGGDEVAQVDNILPDGEGRVTPAKVPAFATPSASNDDPGVSPDVVDDDVAEDDLPF